MSNATLVPVEEYLSTPHEPACEYLDGVLRPKAMGTKKHAQIQFRVCELLRRLGYEALPEVTVRISATRYLIPDVLADRVIEEPYPAKAVLLCIEVLSPEDRLGATLAKCEEYHAWGTPYCWVLDPGKESAWEYHREGEPVRADGVVRAGEIAVALAEIFRG